MNPIKQTLLSLAIAGSMIIPGFAQTSSANLSNQTSAQTGNTEHQAQSQSAKNKTTAKPTASEKAFIRRAAQDDIGEVELGKLAQSKATTDEVRNVANQLVQQHTQNLDQLKPVAARENVQLPTKPEPMQQTEKSRLEKLNGAAFDRAYTHFLVKEHKQDIAKFSAEEKKASDPDLKAYISQTLPTLREHEHMAMQATGSMSHTAKHNAPRS